MPADSGLDLAHRSVLGDDHGKVALDDRMARRRAALRLGTSREEVDRVFALLGCSEVSELTGNHVTVVTRVK